MDFKYYLKKLISELKSDFIENKYLLLLSILIFVIPIFIGYFEASSLKSIMDPLVNSFKQNIKNGTTSLTFLSLFMNNFRVSIMLFAGSALFALFGLFILTTNGLFLGYFGSDIPPIIYLVFILPHGIFEIPALIISALSGFIILSFILKFIKGIIFKKIDEDGSKMNLISKAKYSFNDNSVKLKQALILFVLSTVLLIIAAFIEANLTKPLALGFLSLFS